MARGTRVIFRVTAGEDLFEVLARLFELGCLPSELLPAGYGHINVGRMQFDGMAGAPLLLASDDGRSRPRERLIDGLPGRGVIADRPGHALDWLLGRMAGF
jgi:hypothetical protein